MFRLRNEDDELHEGRNFHLSCLKKVSQNELQGTTEWQTLNSTMITEESFELVTTSKDYKEIVDHFPLIGMIAPYYMQDKN